MGAIPSAVDLDLTSRTISFDQAEINKIPLISKKTIELLVEDNTVVFPKNREASLFYPLTDKLTLLLKLQDRFDNAIRNKTKNKIFSLLKAALYIGFIAGTVFAVMAVASNPLIAIPITCTAFIIAVFAAKYLCRSFGSNGYATIGENSYATIGEMICAPAFTIYYGFTDHTNLKTQYFTLKREVQDVLHNRQLFFNENLGNFNANIIKKIEDCETTITQLRLLKYIPSSTELEVKKTKSEFETAHKEVVASLHYFSSLK